MKSKHSELITISSSTRRWNVISAQIVEYKSKSIFRESSSLLCLTLQLAVNIIANLHYDTKPNTAAVVIKANSLVLLIHATNQVQRELWCQIVFSSIHFDLYNRQSSGTISVFSGLLSSSNVLQYQIITTRLKCSHISSFVISLLNYCKNVNINK